MPSWESRSTRRTELSSREGRADGAQVVAEGAGLRSVRELTHEAAEALVAARDRLRDEAVEIEVDGRPAAKWHLFLDRPNRAIETCAISCALIALVHAGEDMGSPLLERGARMLLALHSDQGGWTSWVESLDERAHPYEETSVIDTFYALQALAAVGYDDRDEYVMGLDWFKDRQHPGNGGWGFFRGDDSYVLPTSMALCALGPTSGTTPVLRDVVGAGREWMIAARDPATGAWGRAVEDPVSAVHTAWALRGLVAAGLPTRAQPIVGAREWLLDNGAEREHIFDAYVMPRRSGASSRSINHVSFADAIVLLGALVAGADLIDARHVALAQRLLDSRQLEAHWRCEGSPHDAPIFAITDACLALDAYTQAVSTHGPMLDIAERVERMRDDVADLVVTVERLETRQALTEGAVTSLRRELAIFAPLRWATGLVLRFPLMSLIVVFALAGALVLFIRDGDRESLLIAGVLGAAVTVLGIVVQTRRTRERDRIEGAQRNREAP